MTDKSTSETFRFPDLYPADRYRLQRLYNLHGRERVIGWLRGKLAVPLRYELDDEFDEENYWNAAVEHYVDTDCSGGDQR